MAKVRPLCKELQEVARRRLNEDADRLAEDIQYMKDWLQKQPHINPRNDDQLLAAFLRGCKHSLERTKEKLDTYYTLRTLLPEFFADRDPLLPEIQAILTYGFLLPLPHAESPTSPKILLMRHDGRTTDVAAILKTNLMILDILLLEDDQAVTCGHYMVQDVRNLSLAIGKTFAPSTMKKAATCMQEAYPTRPQRICVVNANAFFEAIHRMMKVFLDAKLKRRMIVFGERYDELYATVPRRLLPREYGGEAGTVQELAAYWKAKVESYRERFLADARYKTDEAKRPGRPKTSGEMFGIEGSFRRLNVD